MVKLSNQRRYREVRVWFSGMKNVLKCAIPSTPHGTPMKIAHKKQLGIAETCLIYPFMAIMSPSWQ